MRDQDSTISVMRRSLLAIIAILALSIVALVFGGHVVGADFWESGLHRAELVGGVGAISSIILFASIWPAIRSERSQPDPITRDEYEEERIRVLKTVARRRNENRDWIADQMNPGRVVRSEPTDVARLMAPDLEHEVAMAMTSIRQLRAIDPLIHDQGTADALALVNGTLTETIRHFDQARRVANEPERRRMARSTLEAVIDAGRVAETARHDAVARMGEGIDFDRRYIAMRAGDRDLRPLIGRDRGDDNGDDGFDEIGKEG